MLLDNIFLMQIKIGWDKLYFFVTELFKSQIRQEMTFLDLLCI